MSITISNISNYQALGPEFTVYGTYADKFRSQTTDADQKERAALVITGVTVHLQTDAGVNLLTVAADVDMAARTWQADFTGLPMPAFGSGRKLVARLVNGATELATDMKTGLDVKNALADVKMDRPATPLLASHRGTGNSVPRAADYVSFRSALVRLGQEFDVRNLGAGGVEVLDATNSWRVTHATAGLSGTMVAHVIKATYNTSTGAKTISVAVSRLAVG